MCARPPAPSSELGAAVLSISGPARAVLAGERTALNFVGRLSGIATLTAEYVRPTAGTKLRARRCCTEHFGSGARGAGRRADRSEFRGPAFRHRNTDRRVCAPDRRHQAPSSALLY